MAGYRVKFSFYLKLLRDFGIFDLIIRVVFLTRTERSETVSWLRRLFAGLTLHSLRYIPRPAYLRFVVDTVTLGHISI